MYISKLAYVECKILSTSCTEAILTQNTNYKQTVGRRYGVENYGNYNDYHN